MLFLFLFFTAALFSSSSSLEPDREPTVPLDSVRRSVALEYAGTGDLLPNKERFTQNPLFTEDESGLPQNVDSLTRFARSGFSLGVLRPNKEKMALPDPMPKVARMLDVNQMLAMLLARESVADMQAAYSRWLGTHAPSDSGLMVFHKVARSTLLYMSNAAQDAKGLVDLCERLYVNNSAEIMASLKMQANALCVTENIPLDLYKLYRAPENALCSFAQKALKKGKRVMNEEQLALAKCYRNKKKRKEYLEDMLSSRWQDCLTGDNPDAPLLESENAGSRELTPRMKTTKKAVDLMVTTLPLATGLTNSASVMMTEGRNAFHASPMKSDCGKLCCAFTAGLAKAPEALLTENNIKRSMAFAAALSEVIDDNETDAPAWVDGLEIHIQNLFVPHARGIAEVMMLLGLQSGFNRFATAMATGASVIVPGKSPSERKEALVRLVSEVEEAVSLVVANFDPKVFKDTAEHIMDKQTTLKSAVTLVRNLMSLHKDSLFLQYISRVGLIRDSVQTSGWKALKMGEQNPLLLPLLDVDRSVEEEVQEHLLVSKQS